MFLVFVLLPYEVGMFNPFLYSFSFCFIRYEVGLCNPFNIFLLLFYMLRCGMFNPLYIF